MGFIFGDLVVEQILRDGLADFQANAATRLTDFYSQLKENYFNTEYGQAELDRFQTYMANNNIAIVQSWRDIPERVPCIFIQSVSSMEDVGKAMLNDFSGEIDTISGNTLTGRSSEHTIPLNDQIQIGIHVSTPGNATALRWIYALVIYFLISRKDDLAVKGIDLSTFSATDFNRLNEYLPDEIFSRYITFSFLNYVSFTNLVPEQLVDTIDMFGGPNAGKPGERKGGVKAVWKPNRDTEFEDSSFYTTQED